MTPQEKTKELVDKFKEYAHTPWHEVHGFDYNEQMKAAKACAIILCDEIIDVMNADNFYATSLIGGDFIPVEEYWQQVKQSIIKLK